VPRREAQTVASKKPQPAAKPLSSKAVRKTARTHASAAALLPPLAARELKKPIADIAARARARCQEGVP
jgi:hypothetical protein